MKKYSFEDHPEHKAQLNDWSKKWIENAMSTQAMTDEDRSLCVDAVNRMYATVGKKPPRVVFVKSPFVADFSSGFSAAIWYDRKNKKPVRSTRIATHDATCTATDIIARELTHDAIRDICDISTYSESMDKTYVTIDKATIDATREATNDATHDATYLPEGYSTLDAACNATDTETRVSTENATRGAAYFATYMATDKATYDEAHAETRDTIRETTASGDATSEAIEVATREAAAAATYSASRTHTHDAIQEIVDISTYSEIIEATYRAIDDVTMDATFYASDDVTESITNAATKAATSEATGVTTHEATDEKFKNWYVFPTMKMKNVVKHLNGDQNFFMGCASNSWRIRQGGNQWSGWDAFLSFFRHIAKLPIDYSAWDAWETLSLHSGPRYVHEEFCIISDRPELLLVDNRNRPHCDDGPFCRWRDGSALYAVHGVRVPAWIIEFPEAITIEKIDAEENAEVRRVMIQKFGWKNYIDQKGGKLIDKDKNPIFGELWEFLENGTKIQIVYVRNGTQEPDGSYRYYSLRVRPNFTKALDAVMSTYPGLSQEEFMAMSQFRS